MYDGKKLDSRDKIDVRRGQVEVNCEVDGGHPRPQIKLFSGNAVINDVEEEDCRDQVDDRAEYVRSLSFVRTSAQLESICFQLHHLHSIS